MPQISPKQHSKQEDDIVNIYKTAKERLVNQGFYIQQRMSLQKQTELLTILKF